MRTLTCRTCSGLRSTDAALPGARPIFATLVLMIASCLPSATLLAAAKPVGTIEGIAEYRLDNGLQILLYPDQSKPTVTVNLTVFVGSRHEGYGEAGMAHLLEHMVFKGTPDHPKIPKALQDRGARFNGTTWVDRTNYYETLPASDDNLRFALNLEADRLVNSFVKQEDLLSEMTVVRNEFEQGENSPQSVLYDRIMAVAFDWHNYGKSTIGNRIDIERVPIKALQAFYKKYYQADNCLLVVAGKFEPQQALTMIDETFGKLPKPKRRLDATYTEEPPQDGERSVSLRRVGDVALVAAAYHIPSGGHPDSAPIEVLGQILDAPPSGRLYKALVEKKLATEVSANATSWHDAGALVVLAEVRKDDSLDTARETLIEVTEQVGSQPVTEEEVERARQKILKQRELNASDTSQIAIELSEWAAQGDWRMYFLHRDRIEQVTPADVERVARDYLMRNNRTVAMFLPSERTERTNVPPTPSLAKLLEGYQGRGEIAAGESFDVSPVSIEKRALRSTLPEGLKIVLLPKKTRGESVQAQLTLRYGSAGSLQGHQVASEILPQLMLRGTRQLSRQQVQDALDKERATITATGSLGSLTFRIETRRANLPAVLSLIGQILREPALAPDEFELLRRQRLAQFETQLTDPQMLAVVAVRRKVSPYPADDVRYIPTVEEEIERANQATPQQVRELYGKFVGAQAGELAMVGDFDAAEVASQFGGLVSGWVSAEPYERIPRIAFTEVPASLEEILTPDKANAVYVAGLAFEMRDDNPLYPAVLIGNYILGGGSLSSRLGDRVRQKEGLSYGVGSFVVAESLDERASLTMFAITNPQNIRKVVTAIQEEVVRLVAQGVSADELIQARQGYLEQQQVSRSDDARLASILADTAYADRTMEYHAKVEQSIAALTPDIVQESLKQWLTFERLTVVAAGDFAAASEQQAQEKAEEPEEPQDEKAEEPPKPRDEKARKPKKPAVEKADKPAKRRSGE